MMIKTKYPKPGEIWMGNFMISSVFTPMLLSYTYAHKNTFKKNTVLIISKIETELYARYMHKCSGQKRISRLIAQGLCEGKIVGIEDVDISDSNIEFTRIA